MGRIPVAVAASLLVLLGAATPAFAAPTVLRLVDSAGTIGFRLEDASSTVNSVYLDKGFGTDTLEFHSVIGGDITLTAGATAAGCVRPTNVSVSCPRVIGGRVMQMVVDTGPLDDDVSTSSTLPVGVTMLGGAGSDTLTGGPGADLIVPGAGQDIPDGGDGRDTISFDDGRPGAVAFNLGPGGTTVDGGEDDVNFENAIGTPFGDTLIGDAGNNELHGLAGGDSLDGFIGNDLIDGGGSDDFSLVGDEGDDVILGGTGVTITVDGGDGNDTFSYEDHGTGVTASLAAGLQDVTSHSGLENLRGGPGDDNLTGDAGPNRLEGLGGADNLESGPGNDHADGGAGRDALELGDGDDGYATVDGEADTVDCSTGIDHGSADAIDTLIACDLPAPPPGGTTPPPAPVTTSPAPLTTSPASVTTSPAADTTPPAPDTTPPAPVTTPPAPVTSARIGAQLSQAFTARSAFTRVTTLTLTSLPAGSTVRVTCKAATKDRRKKGKAAPCPFSSRTTKVPAARSKLELAGLFRGRRLTPGTVLTVAVTAPGVIGSLRSYTMRAGKTPRSVLMCIPPGGKPEAC